MTLAAGSAGAQGLTMQMSNGWSFSFAGNVNAFAMFTTPTCGTTSPTGGCAIPGGLVAVSETEKAFRIRTGLLPAFATFEAKGKEGPVDLGVHFGFAPQIQNANRVHDQFGAQIDMRQVYLTVGGANWGQILAGREIGLYQRSNILTDMTLFGVGVSGGANGGGTTLGRIGTGYVYPNFVPQITYSTPASKPAQLSIGIFDPSVVLGPAGTAVPYDVTKTPRVEAEFTWTGHFGAAAAAAPSDKRKAAADNKIMIFASGAVQNVKSALVTDSSLTSWGGAGGVKLDVSGFSLVGSGYYGQGIGTTLMFDSGFETDVAGKSRKSYGFIGQAEYQFPETKWKLGASYGESDLKLTENESGTPGFVKKNSSIVGALTYQWTKSLRWVGEYTYAKSKAFDDTEAHSNQGALGMMLFF
jgi:predicted porin